jgi:pimeloyl-ACP methyl ester carboxylesterase
MKTPLLAGALAGLVLSASASARVEQPVRAQAPPPPLQLRSSCVTRAERRRVVRFRAADGIRLIGVLLGKGPHGLVLSHGYHQSVCDWIGHARRLARAGYRVRVFDHRNHGSSTYTRKRYWPELRLGADGVVSLSAPTHISTVDAEAAVGRLAVPTLFVAAEDDDPFDDDARTLFAASAAREKQLEMVPASGAHGTGLLQLESVRALFDELLRSHSD